MCVKTFSPVHLGVPSQRPRQHTAFHLHPWVDPKFEFSFEDIFYGDLSCDARMGVDPKHPSRGGLQGLEGLQGLRRVS